MFKNFMFASLAFLKREKKKGKKIKEKAVYEWAGQGMQGGTE
jgi:hypothetical protein